MVIPLYQRAETLFMQARDARDALYARIGVMRTSDQASFPDISAFISGQLQTPVVQHDPFLRLWCLGVKGDADQETNVAAAERDWNQVKTLATHLGQKEWANRATGHQAQAIALMKSTLAEVRREKMWEHEGQDLLILGEMATNSGDGVSARTYLNAGVESAKRMGLYRVVAQSYLDLAALSQKADDLPGATNETEQGDTLPVTG